MPPKHLESVTLRTLLLSYSLPQQTHTLFSKLHDLASPGLPPAGGARSVNSEFSCRFLSVPLPAPPHATPPMPKLLLILTVVSSHAVITNAQIPTTPFLTYMMLRLQVSSPSATSLKPDAILQEHLLSESLPECLAGDCPVLCYVPSLRLECTIGNYNTSSSWHVL